MRFLLVDRITKLEPGRCIEGVKCWSLADEVFRDHFPGAPIVPGVLLVESMAQLVGFLIEHSYRRAFGDEEDVGALLSIIHKAKFRRFVVPGECVEMQGVLLSFDPSRASCRIRAAVDGQIRAESDLSFVIHTWEAGSMGALLREQRESYSRVVMAGLTELARDR